MNKQELINQPKIAVISDFDGTITNEDSLTLLLDKYGASDWIKWEEKYEEGSINGAEALEAEISELNINLKDAVRFVQNNITIKDNISELVTLCNKKNIPLTIVSCNFEELIVPIFNKYNLLKISLCANHLREKNGRLYIEAGKPFSPHCKYCHHCKTETVKKFRDEGFFTIYLGDGLTDRCPAFEADSVFAAGRLAYHMQLLNMPFKRLDSFTSVINFIENILSGTDEVKSAYVSEKRNNKINPFLQQDLFLKKAT